MPGGQKKQRGDTIVEVMVVLAILGLALGICYATANRSLLNTRQAQENSEASELVQSQIEALRNMAGNTSGNDDIFTHNGPFCVSTSSGDHIEPTTDSSCTNQDSFYNLSVVYGPPEDSKSFKVIASWDDVEGQGTDTVTMYYRLNPGQAGTSPGGGGTTASCNNYSSIDSYAWQSSDVYIASDDSGNFPYYTTTNQNVPGGKHGPTLSYIPSYVNGYVGQITITGLESPVICVGQWGTNHYGVTQADIVGNACTIYAADTYNGYDDFEQQDQWAYPSDNNPSNQYTTGIINADGKCADRNNPTITSGLQFNDPGTFTGPNNPLKLNARTIGPLIVVVALTKNNPSSWLRSDTNSGPPSMDNVASSGPNVCGDAQNKDHCASDVGYTGNGYYWNYLIACPPTQADPSCPSEITPPIPNDANLSQQGG